MGQIIGNEVQDMLLEPMRIVAKKKSLYLDYFHPREARDFKKKVRWFDSTNNSHDLDYVMESGGTEKLFGDPTIFIEIAWRRYAKHSRNKIKEILGSLLPLQAKHHAQFAGVVLCGNFTKPALNEITSNGLSVAMIEYDTIIDAYKTVGADLHFDEATAESESVIKINQYDNLSNEQKNDARNKILNFNKTSLLDFLRKTKLDDNITTCPANIE